jgi:hypothetical protein
MLPERSFEIGGALTIVLSGILLGAVIWAGVGLDYFGYWIVPPMLAVFGIFLLYVGRQARSDRRRLLALAESSLSDPAKAPPSDRTVR